MNDHSHPTDELKVLKCSGSADFLAALPQLAGYTATNSVFLVFFNGSRAKSAARVDLPSEDTHAATRSLIEFICGAVDELHQGDCPAIVITCSQSFASNDGPPWRAFAKRLERALKRDGVLLRDLCIQASDAWVSLFDPAAPRGGRPLSDIAESPIALAASLAGHTPPDLTELGAAPTPDRQRAAAVLRELEAQPPRQFDEGDWEDPRLTHEWIAAPAHALRELRHGEDPLSAADTARLIRCAATSDGWLIMALGVLTRPEFPVELASEFHYSRFIAAPVDIDVDEPIAAVGAAARPGLAFGLTEQRPSGWSLRRVILTTSLDFTDRQRLPRIRARLATVISETPTELRGPLLGFNAWLWWLGGSQSVSARLAGEALEIAPECALSQTAARIVEFPLYQYETPSMPWAA